MTNPPKKKGTAAEVALLRWLHGNGREAVRNPPCGNRDVGDLAVILDADDPRQGVIGETCVVEVKNVKNLGTAVRDGLRELAVEKMHAVTGHGVLVVKPHGVGIDRVGEWYAIRRVADDPELGAA